jgi:F-type H+-transporting ATPase subunit a
VIALEFPPINEILRWKDLFPTFNKIALIAVAAALIGTVVFLLAGRKDAKVAPKGVRNFAESIVEFIENGIIMQTMGRDGLGWTPFLLSLFSFIYLCNVPGIIPLFPPGVPKALYLLVTPIEFISTFLVRPFSLTVRLFANMLAGHILLVTFALLSEALFQAEGNPALIPVGVLPLFMLIFLTGFEVLVAFLQAYIFTILTAVYIGGAAHPEH